MHTCKIIWVKHIHGHPRVGQKRTMIFAEDTVQPTDARSKVVGPWTSDTNRHLSPAVLLQLIFSSFPGSRPECFGRRCRCSPSAPRRSETATSRWCSYWKDSGESHHTWLWTDVMRADCMHPAQWTVREGGCWPQVGVKRGSKHGWIF